MHDSRDYVVCTVYNYISIVSIQLNSSCCHMNKHKNVDFFFNRRCQEEFKEVTSAPELHIKHIGLTFFIGELMLNMKVCFIFESYVIHISVYSFSCS